MEQNITKPVPFLNTRRRLQMLLAFAQRKRNSYQESGLKAKHLRSRLTMKNTSLRNEGIIVQNR